MSSSICRGCGIELPPMKRPGNPRVWCSGPCRARALRKAEGKWTVDQAVPTPCDFCAETFVPARKEQRFCSTDCGWRGRHSTRTPCPDWAEGRRPEREIPCMDCGSPIMSRANRQACPACKAIRSRTTNRRKRVARKSAPVGIRYTLGELGDRDGWRCHLCRKSVDRTLPGTAQDGPTVDHLIPISDGGADDLENVALAHRSCNVKRGNKGIAQLRLTG